MTEARRCWPSMANHRGWQEKDQEENSLAPLRELRDREDVIHKYRLDKFDSSRSLNEGSVDLTNRDQNEWNPTDENEEDGCDKHLESVRQWDCCLTERFSCIYFLSFAELSRVFGTQLSHAVVRRRTCVSDLILNRQIWMNSFVSYLSKFKTFSGKIFYRR